MKPVAWMGDSRKRMREFSPTARQQAGHELMRVQSGREPTDWKPMPSIGVGAKEIRVRDASGAWRVIYVAKFEEAVYVLHAFQKKTQRTSKQDLDKGKARYKLIP